MSWAKAKPDVPVRINGQPWLIFSGSDRRYQPHAPSGGETLAVIEQACGPGHFAA
jgi:hypothetical protein